MASKNYCLQLHAGVPPLQIGFNPVVHTSFASTIRTTPSSSTKLLSLQQLNNLRARRRHYNQWAGWLLNGYGQSLDSHRYLTSVLWRGKKATPELGTCLI